MYFASNLKILRKNNNMSQDELADILNYSFKNISKWENNQSIPSYDVLLEISKVFNISVKSLMEEDLSELDSVKYKTTLLSNNFIYPRLQKEIFNFLYTSSTCYVHKIIKFYDNNLIFENFLPSKDIMILLKKEATSLDKLIFIIDSVIKQLKFNGLISYYEIKKEDNYIDIGYQI